MTSSAQPLRVRLHFDEATFPSFGAPLTRTLLFPIDAAACLLVSDVFRSIERHFASLANAWPDPTVYSCDGAALLPSLPSSVLRDGDLVQSALGWRHISCCRNSAHSLTATHSFVRPLLSCALSVSNRTVDTPPSRLRAGVSGKKRRRGQRGSRGKGRGRRKAEGDNSRPSLTFSTSQSTPPSISLAVVPFAPPSSTAEPPATSSSSPVLSTSALPLGKGHYRFTEDDAIELVTTPTLFVQPEITSRARLHSAKKGRGGNFPMQLSGSSPPPPPSASVDTTQPIALRRPPRPQPAADAGEPVWMEEMAEAKQRVMDGLTGFGAFHFAPRTLKAVGLSTAEAGATAAADGDAAGENQAAFAAQCPPLNGEGAQVGDVLLYRLMELTDSWTPSLSPYRSARVTRVGGEGEASAQQLTFRPTLHAAALGKAAATHAGWKKVPVLVVPEVEGVEEEEVDGSALLDVRVVEGPSYTACSQRWREEQRRAKKDAKWREKLQRAEVRAQGQQLSEAAATESKESSPPISVSQVPSTAVEGVGEGSSVSRAPGGMSAALALLRQRQSRAGDGEAVELERRRAAALLSAQELHGIGRGFRG